LDRSTSTLLLDSKPQVHQKADRPSVMADQIAHEHIRYVSIQGWHRYTGH
jgi:hypothetical protein